MRSPVIVRGGLQAETMAVLDDDALELPAPFKALPRLLRDDALVHLKREMKATATLQSLHPLSGVQLGTDQAPPYKLTLAGAAQLTIQLDQRSELNGTAHLLFTADERGEVVLGRFDGVAAAGGWKNIKVPASDTVYVRARGSAPAPFAPPALCLRAASCHW